MLEHTLSQYRSFSALFSRLTALARYGFPWTLGRPRTPVELLRRHSLPERFRGRPLVMRLALYVFCTLAWPVAAAVETRRNLPLLGERRFKARLHAGLSMYGLALWRNIPPVEYVAYGFRDPRHRRQLPEYIFWIDADAVKRLNRLRGANPEDVQHKARFAAICATYQLPHAPILAQFRAGNPSIGVTAADLAGWGPALWVKPLRLQGGVGAERWLARADGRFDDGSGHTLSPAALLARLRGRDCLLQPVLRNHSTLQRLTNGSLAALRLVTGLHRDGRTCLLGNLLVLPQGHSIASGGGLVCVMDWATGTIIEARANSPRYTAERHPDTGEPLIGHTLPFWREALLLVQEAHRQAFSSFATLGWDVALTQDGPLLLEANSGWEAMAHQVISGPMGKTALSAIIAVDLAAASKGSRARR